MSPSSDGSRAAPDPNEVCRRHLQDSAYITVSADTRGMKPPQDRPELPLHRELLLPISSPLLLVAEIERLLAVRHHGPVDVWNALTDQLASIEEQLLQLPKAELREATDALLTLLHNVVESEGLSDDD